MMQVSFMGELVLALRTVVDLAFQIYILILVARVLITWVNPDPYNPIVRFLSAAADPLLNRVRRMVPLQFGGIDFSPIITVVALSFIAQLLSRMLLRLAYSI